MITKCSWCSKEIKDDNNPDKEVSHGICEKCKKELMAKVGYLDKKKKEDECLFI